MAMRSDGKRNPLDYLHDVGRDTDSHIFHYTGTLLGCMRDNLQSWSCCRSDSPDYTEYSCWRYLGSIRKGIVLCRSSVSRADFDK